MQLQSEVRKCIKSWLKVGVIRPSKSPYASQVVIVRKKTGEIRLCINFRKLNVISIRDSFPLPRIEEALQAVQAAMWFTSFDLAQGYLQMAMEEADIPKTTFRAGSTGFYEFLRMPFGLTNAGASFCRLMEMCIGDQQYVTLLFCLDDICVFAENADDMLDRVELVFQRLKSFNLKVKPKKSFYFQDEVNFLWHILSAKGMSPNPEKVEKVKNWPIPTNPKEVHSFVGLLSAEKSWKDYSSANIELLAVNWAVCEKFKDYLLGSKFTMYTDNNPLVYIKSSKLGAAQIRWLSELALYDFNIIYRTGKSNLVADALSR